MRNTLTLRTGLTAAACASGLMVGACGGGGGDPGSPGAPDTAARTAAATSTAQSGSNACNAIRPFYWEIGDRSQRLAGASLSQAGNTTTYTADTLMAIASASKWLYGAYVAEKRGGVLTAQDIQFLTFSSGSADALGFYPWVDVSKTWYGIVARDDALGGGNESADCGALIRKAWVTSIAQ